MQARSLSAVVVNLNGYLRTSSVWYPSPYQRDLHVVVPAGWAVVFSEAKALLELDNST